MTNLIPIYMIVLALAIVGLALGWKLGGVLEPIVQFVVRGVTALVVGLGMAAAGWFGVAYLVSRI